MGKRGWQRIVTATALFALVAVGIPSRVSAEPIGPAGSVWPVASTLHPAAYRDLSRDGVVLSGPGTTRVRYRAARDHPTPSSPVASGRLVAQSVVSGLAQVYPWLHDSLGLAEPEAFEVLLTDLTGHSGPRYLPGGLSDGGSILLVHDSPSGGLDSMQAAVGIDYARAMLSERLPGLPEHWVAGAALYARVATGGADGATLPVLSSRVSDLDRGLLRAPSVEFGGHALWLAFLEENFGIAALKSTLQAVSSSSRAELALDKALRQSAGTTLAEAFREFQLWTTLSGSRDDSLHFSFGSRLTEADFATDESGLPALSVQSNPSVAPWGAVQLRLEPDESQGGVRLLFEGGGFETVWELDLLWNHADGTRHRIAVELEDGRGEIALPLQGAESIWLMIRNLGGNDVGEARYTFAAHHEPDFPVEFSTLEVLRNQAEPSGVVVSWDTRSEEDLVGFSVLRRRGNQGAFRPVDGVWIPALGQVDRPSSYRLMDREIEPGVEYEYRVQAITRWGLVVVSPVATVPAGS